MVGDPPLILQWAADVMQQRCRVDQFHRNIQVPLQILNIGKRLRLVPVTDVRELCPVHHPAGGVIGRADLLDHLGGLRRLRRAGHEGMGLDDAGLLAGNLLQGISQLGHVVHADIVDFIKDYFSGLDIPLFAPECR